MANILYENGFPIKAIVNGKLADVQEIRRGRWIKNPPTEAWEYHCSLCGTQEDYKENYCRNCGAAMIEEEE